MRSPAFVSLFLVFATLPLQSTPLEAGSDLTRPEEFLGDALAFSGNGAPLPRRQRAPEIMNAGYRGSVHTRATAFGTSKVFDRKFQVNLAYSLNPGSQAKATTQEIELCESDEEGVPIRLTCVHHCETTVKLELGSADLGATDLAGGEDGPGKKGFRQVLSVTAVAKRHEPKRPRDNCDKPLDMDGAEIHSEPVKTSHTDEHGRSLYLIADPYDSRTKDEEHVVRSRLKKLGGDVYGLSSAAPAKSTRVFWIYTHESDPVRSRSWGTSGDTVMQKE